MVIEYLDSHDEITNRQGRVLTGIKSENSMKRIFWKLRDRGLIEMIPERPLCKSAWRKKQ
jgi:ATP-dependent DNA helicase RecG